MMLRLREAVVLALVHIASSTTLFSDDFSVDPRTSNKWLFNAATATYDRTTRTLTSGRLVTQSSSAAMMTGTQNGAIHAGRSFDASTLGGSYSVSLTWSAGFLQPMDEDVQIYLCNLPPSSFVTGTLQFPTVNPRNLWPHTNGQFLGAHCVGGDVGYTRGITGTSAFPIEANLAYVNGTSADGRLGRASTGRSCDARDIATATGKASVVQTLTVNGGSPRTVSFTTNMPGCGPLTRTIGNSFNPNSPAWIIIVTDDDNVRAPANRCAQSPAMMQEMRLFAQTLRGVFGVVISRALSFTLSRLKASA